MKIIHFIIRMPYFFLKKYRKKFYYFINKLFYPINRYNIKKNLQRIGLENGMIVYVHSSMSSFGYVRGGHDSVINPILNIIGNEGTIVMPTFTHKTDIFNPENTKSWTGAISESLRYKKNSIRSVHPTHSVAAFGALASEITKGHEKSKSPFDEKSPFHKLANKESYILMLGTENNSMIHYVQNKVNFPNLFLEGIFDCKYILNEKIKSMKTKIHHPDGSIKYICNGKECSDVEFLIKMYNNLKFEERDYMKTVKIGKATCHLINTQDFVKEATKYLKDNIKRYKDEYSSLIENA